MIRTRLCISFFLIFGMGTFAFAQSSMLHSTWDKLLRKYVDRQGFVNYKGLVNEKDALRKYLDRLEAKPPRHSESRQAHMAYWINLYNAATIYQVLLHYPIKSIKEIDRGKVWDKKWIRRSATKISLNQIEKEILLKKYKDARLHMLINCAARSCPALLNRAMTADNVEHYLNERTRKFVKHKNHNNVKADALHLSQIFQWYADDFGNIQKFIAEYSDVKVSPNARVYYKKYNWALNEL